LLWTGNVQNLQFTGIFSLILPLSACHRLLWLATKGYERTHKKKKKVTAIASADGIRKIPTNSYGLFSGLSSFAMPICLSPLPDVAA
jgi:hypothetical protein